MFIIRIHTTAGDFVEFQLKSTYPPLPIILCKMLEETLIMTENFASVEWETITYAT